MRYSSKVRHQLHWLLVAIYTGTIIAILAAVFGTVALTMAPICQ